MRRLSVAWTIGHFRLYTKLWAYIYESYRILRYHTSCLYMISSMDTSELVFVLASLGL